ARAIGQVSNTCVAVAARGRYGIKAGGGGRQAHNANKFLQLVGLRSPRNGAARRHRNGGAQADGRLLIASGQKRGVDRGGVSEEVGRRRTAELTCAVVLGSIPD
nr:hypothetical protein [Tanacetum cinerariifolium]